MAATTTDEKPNVAQQALASIKTRVDELRPLVQEHEELQKLLDAIEGSSRTKKATSGSGTQTRRHYARQGGKRSDQFLALVKEQPGITVSDAAKAMEIHPNYLYRVSSELVNEGLIRKEDKGFVPADTTE